MALEVAAWEEFRAYTFPAIEYVLAPWLPTRGLCMVAGHRGIGKTFFTTSLAWAIATGGCVLGYAAGTARTVSYIDGEMDPAELQQRFIGLEQASRDDGCGDVGLAGQNFGILTHGAFEFGLPDLSDREGQDLFEEAVREREVLVLDNLSCLVRSGEENTADSWAPIQEWLVSLRRDGHTTILVHHTGKPNQEGGVSQRGTSKREDPLNASLMLTHPQETRRAGAMQLVFTKLRSAARGSDIEEIRKGRRLQVTIEDDGATRLVTSRAKDTKNADVE